MSKKRKTAGVHNPYKEFLKLLRQAEGKHDTYTVFRDFCEMAALSFHNSILHDSAIEERYLKIVKGYEPDKVNLFSHMLAELTLAMEDEITDHLGHAFNDLELANKHRGQFFTPYDLSRAIAELTIDDSLKQRIAENGFITVAEPACGSGGMIVAFCEQAMAAGIDYQRCIHVTAQDVDSRAVHMTYIQLTLMHCPAIVFQGNTLTMETTAAWRTPAHVLGFWDAKLRRRSEATTVEAQVLPKPVQPVRRVAAPAEQMELLV